jgi:hypothetical protein
LKGEEKSELVENFHRFITLKHSTALPSVFTEKGLYMLATILKSERAIPTAEGSRKKSAKCTYAN